MSSSRGVEVSPADRRPSGAPGRAVAAGMLALCLACGGGSSGLSAEADPSGDWSMILAVTDGTGDGVESVGSARLFTATIQASPGGEESFELSLVEAGGGGLSLLGTVEGDQLHLSGETSWTGGEGATASVYGSSVSVGDSILYGEVDVQLSGDASGTERWYLSAFNDGSAGIEALGWWQLDQEILFASGDYDANVGDSVQTLLVVGPHEPFKFVVAWWRSDGTRGVVTHAQGPAGFNVSGWSWTRNEGGLTWTETVEGFVVDVEGESILPRTITLTASGDRVGDEISTLTGSRVPPGTSSGFSSGVWAERFLGSARRQPLSR